MPSGFPGAVPSGWHLHFVLQPTLRPMPVPPTWCITTVLYKPLLHVEHSYLCSPLR